MQRQEMKIDLNTVNVQKVQWGNIFGVKPKAPF